MCGSHREDRGVVAVQRPAGRFIAAFSLLLMVTISEESAAGERSERRLFDGAPPTIPHQSAVGECTSCHSGATREIPSMGIAPASPHTRTAGLQAVPCKQCHVEKRSGESFVESTFRGIGQDLRPGRRANTLAPPVIPHMVFMRENCAACHTGAAARKEIRTSHPERTNCRQCHVERLTAADFIAPATESKPKE